MSSLAILVPNYNGAAFIGATVERFAAGFPGALVVVVDDASTDDSRRQLSATPAHVISRDCNGGFAAAVNAGLRYLATAGYDQVLVANSDVVADGPTCARIAAALVAAEGDPTVAVLGFLEESSTRSPEGSDISGFLFALRMSTLASVGYFDESFFMYGEEQDYFRRVIEAGLQIRQTGIRARHLSEASGSSRLRNSWLAIRNSIYLEAKRFAWWRMCRKAGVLFLMINRLYRPAGTGDPSLRRVLRPGVLLGNIFLLSALCWNAGKLIKTLVHETQSQSRGQA
jgi:GT2 family glycosyltransferase